MYWRWDVPLVFRPYAQAIMSSVLIILYCFNCSVGDLPLCNETRKRLRRIKARVIDIMDTGNRLLAYLYQERVIGDTDYHCLLSESLMTNRSSMLMDVILRGSDRGFACFCNCLSSDVNQAYLVPCFQKGTMSSLLYCVL